jgi:hypothetical protein
VLHRLCKYRYRYLLLTCRINFTLLLLPSIVIINLCTWKHCQSSLHVWWTITHYVPHAHIHLIPPPHICCCGRAPRTRRESPPRKFPCGQYKRKIPVHICCPA